jgi:uncharacterized membrane protein
MNDASGWHWLVVIAILCIVAAIMFFAAEGRKQRANGGAKEIFVETAAQRDEKIQNYVKQGYSSAFTSDSSVMLSRKLKLNWVFMIILICIPFIGWGAILYLIFRNKHAVDTVTVRLKNS